MKKMGIIDYLIKIKSSILQKIKEHAKNGFEENKSEIIGFLIGYFSDKNVEIHDIVIPEQNSTNIHAESVDELPLIEYLKQDNTNKIQVGWYHSHPNFGCFLSSVDIETQKYWQRINNKMVAIVIDPVKNETKAFRLDNNNDVYEITIEEI
ncbi:MAG: hypothetical protein GF329_14675 [Candidatus Lokiarchaeota archaeon]|nr:hypothetical protein [Candidatus Lokiarchaeota archaeon]